MDVRSSLRGVGVLTGGVDTRLFSRSKVRLVGQSEAAECGLACLAMVASFHGLDVDMNTLRRSFTASSRGMSLRALMGVADGMDLSPRAVRVALDDLAALSLPAVLHWDMNHFVVLEAVSRRSAFVHDPTGRSAWLRFAEVSDHFTGVALELHPGAGFKPGDVRRRLRLRNLWSRLKGSKRALAQTVLLSLVMQFFAAVAPYYGQIAIDGALPDADHGLLTTLAFAFALFAVLNGATTMLRSSVLLSVGANFGFGLSSNVVRRLFRLPVDWFARRQVGDVLSRFQSVTPLRQMLAEDAPASLVDGAFALFTLVLMFVYSAALATVSATTILLYSLIRTAFYGAQRASQETMMVAGGREQSVLIESVQGMRSLRLSGRETMRHAVWQARMNDAVNGAVSNQRLINWQSMLHTVLFALENVVTIWLAVRMVIGGTFSLGMLFAFLAYKTQFLNAGASLVEKVFSFRMLGLHLERLAEIALADEDIAFETGLRSEAVLAGRIELRDIRYRYGISDAEVLKGVNLAVSPGEAVAITGPSGGGKTTLVHLLLGLFQPTSGEVLVDGVPIATFGHRNYFSKVAAVLQDDTLFSGSLAENIAMFDEEPSMVRVQNAARAAAIHDDILAMPMQYATLVGGMGTSLSGGQKQRVVLARALYREPRVLVMDEATSHLDGAKEREVNAAIKALGITRVIVAHRKETIASADRVLLLSEGIITEMPTADREQVTAVRRVAPS